MPQPTGWQFVSIGATATGTVSLSISLPANVVDNDMLTMVVTHRGAGYGVFPAGWTLIPGCQAVTAGGMRFEVYERRANADVGPYSVTGLATRAVGYIIANRGGRLTGSFVNGTPVSRVNVAGTNGCGPLTTTVPNTLVMFFTAKESTYSGATFGVRHGSIAPNLTISMDPELSSLQSFGTANNTDIGQVVSRGLKQVAGSTIDDFRVVTNAGSFDNICFAVAFEPETGGATSGTRYYLTPKTPILPRREPWALQGDWNDTFIDGKTSKHIFQCSMLSQQRPGQFAFFPSVTSSGTQLACNQQGNFDALYRRFITPPLQAQTLAGTFQLTIGLNIRWKNTLGTLSNDSSGRLKVHGYVTVGQTTAVRSVFLDNFVDPTDINNANNNIIWTGLTVAASMAGVVIEAGDSIVIELGVRIVASPTPDPGYPPTEWTQLQVVAIGTGLISSALIADGVIGGTVALPQLSCAHFDFTDTILEQSWTPASNANVSPSTATDITALLPFSEVETPYNTHGSTSNARSGWYKITAPRDGTLIVTARGTMGYVDLSTFTGPSDAYADLTTNPGTLTFQDNAGQRCLTIQAVPVIEGETYYFRANGRAIQGDSGIETCLSVSVAYQEPPIAGDKFLPNRILACFRGDALINFNQDFASFSPSGCAIDYTRRPMEDIGNPGTPNENYRLFVGMFSIGIVEIFDLTTLNRDELEVDFILNAMELASGRFANHIAALHMTRAGFLYVQNFGDGFRYVIGFAIGIPADLASGASFDDLGYVRGIDGLHADNQPGEPWPLASELPAAKEQSEPWAGALNETTGILIYASGGLYITLPVPLPTTSGSGQVAKQYNVFSDTQQGDLSSPTAVGLNQGLKNGCVLSDGSVVMTNGSQMVRLNGTTGALIQTYTPISDYPVSLIDVHPEPDGIHLTAIDLNSIDMFTFNISTGVQTDRIRTWGAPRNLIQFAIFTPNDIPVPIPELRTEIRYRRRQRTVPHLSDEQKIFRYNRLQLDVMTGIGTTEGQGIDPVVYMRFSDDGAHRWSDEYAKTTGRLGDYKKRVIWRRLGSSRDRVFEFVMSDPVKWVLLDAYLEMAPGTT